MSHAAPGLKRVLSRWDLVIYGLVILGPTAPYPVYGIVQKLSNGHAPLAYLVAMVAVLFTAASYGKMAGAFPSAGSTYTYVKRSLNENAGFLAGWAMILDYLLIPLVSIIYAALTAHRLLPVIPYEAWAVLFSVALTLVNIPGIRVTARAGEIMMAVMVICATAFVALAVKFVIDAQGTAGLLNGQVIYSPQTFALRPLMLGAGVAALSYIGFDAISTLAEDTVNPRKDIPIATIAVCILQTAVCFVTVYLAALVWAHSQAFPDPDTAILDIGRKLGGTWMFLSLTVVLLVAGLASALTGQAGASRLLYGMGRDRMLPPGIFAYLHPKYSTPTRGIYVMGAFSLLGSIFLRFEIAVELLNFGAFAGFILVNLSVIRHFFVRLHRRHGTAIFSYLIFPACGALSCAYLWMSLSGKAKVAGFLWLFIGAAYLAVLTRGFRQMPAATLSLEQPDEC